MKRTDFYHAYKLLDNLACQELTAAMRACGKDSAIIESEEADPVIIVGAFKYSPSSEDIVVTKVVLDKSGNHVEIYGKPNNRWSEREERVEYIESGYIEYIIDAIPFDDDNVKIRDFDKCVETAAEIARLLCLYNPSKKDQI